MLTANASIVIPRDPNMIDPVIPMLITALYLFLILIPVILVLFFFFYKKKLQHQQILAAIEKGHPIEDLLSPPAQREKGWVANISAGVGLLLVAGGLIFLYFPAGVYAPHNLPENYLIAIPVILIGMGITRLIRGFYQKKEAAQSDNTPDKPGFSESVGGAPDMTV